MELAKKGVFFSTDALIALLIILVVLFMSYPFIRETKIRSDVSSDILDSLSNLKVGETNNSYVLSLINNDEITDLNKSLLEQIGEFSINDVNKAKMMTNSLLSNLETNENIGIWYGSNLIFSRNSTSYENAVDVEINRKFISGIKEGESATGFSARAFLSSSARSEIVYFGGYVGDGNLSVRTDYEGDIISAVLEFVINKDFDLYVNGNFVGNYSHSPNDLTPVRYDLPIGYFTEGENLVEFRGNLLYIAGGFLKITYEDGVSFFEGERKYYIPGVDGLVNIYDGLSVDGRLDEMEIFLHAKSETNPIFVTIGNKTVFNSTTIGVETFTLNNAYLDSLLNYDEISNGTMPLRIGLENVSYVVNASLDLISIFDSSTTMAPFRSALQAAHYILIDQILVPAQMLEFPKARMGMIGYRPTVPQTLFHPLSSNFVSLRNTIDNWANFNSQNRDLCRGIEKAIEDFTTNPGGANPVRVAVISNAGNLTHACGGASGGQTEANSAAISMACDIAHGQHNVTFYTLGFGNDAEEATLRAIAACSGGEYFYGELTDLGEIYDEVVNSILLRYQLQTIEIVAGQVHSRIFPDSYINVKFNESQSLYGLIITLEKQFTNDLSGSFDVPSDTTPLEAQVVSYSGPRWTNVVTINTTNVYNISYYGSEFISIGDPYRIVIPISLVNKGQNNVFVNTISSSDEEGHGSQSNKVIYTLLKNASSFSDIVFSAEGCLWNLEFEDGSVLNVNIPNEYLGGEVCVFNSTTHTLSDSVANQLDAFQLAVFELLIELDTDQDGLIDVLFSEQDLQADLDTVTGIPIPYTVEVQARRWAP